MALPTLVGNDWPIDKVIGCRSFICFEPSQQIFSQVFDIAFFINVHSKSMFFVSYFL